MLLSSHINWTALENDLGLIFFPDKAGQPPKPVRLIVGLLMLQHMEGVSDEMAVAKWVENPYWQSFCRFDFLQWKMLIDPSSLTWWRDRIGEKAWKQSLAILSKRPLVQELRNQKGSYPVMMWLP